MRRAGRLRWVWFFDASGPRPAPRPQVTFVGSDGAHYTFLAKPKDDLRKDNRMMEAAGGEGGQRCFSSGQAPLVPAACLRRRQRTDAALCSSRWLAVLYVVLCLFCNQAGASPRFPRHASPTLSLRAVAPCRSGQPPVCRQPGSAAAQPLPAVSTRSGMVCKPRIVPSLACRVWLYIILKGPTAPSLNR